MKKSPWIVVAALGALLACSEAPREKTQAPSAKTPDATGAAAKSAALSVRYASAADVFAAVSSAKQPTLLNSWALW